MTTRPGGGASAEQTMSGDAPADPAGQPDPVRPIGAGQPSLTVGRIVHYVGFRRENLRHAGLYRVREFTNCFDITCTPMCDRFLYLLEPLNPAACGLDPGFGVAAHGVAALTPADAPSTSRNLS